MEVYVLRSLRDGKRYVGISSDSDVRLVEHNSGKVFSTKGRRPFVLTYREYTVDVAKARQRERFFKTAVGRRFLDEVEKPLWRSYLAKNNSRL